MLISFLSKFMYFNFSEINENLIENKLIHLKTIIKNCNSALLAFSGGVDSSFLALMSKEVLDYNNLVLVTVISDVFSNYEIELAKQFAIENNFKHIFINIDIFQNEMFIKNTKDRCYYCKKTIFSNLLLKAKELNLNYVFSGVNFDDLNDYRPGILAQNELNIISPLLEAKLTKLEIRYLLKKLNNPFWNRPQMACLMSRIPYNINFTKEILKKIENCEEFLRNLGFYQYRVRYHENLARIEIDTLEFEKLLLNRENIISFFKKQGFLYITLDLEGFRTGSFNLTINNK